MMLLGRALNLWTGLIAATVGFIELVIGVVAPDIAPQAIIILGGGGGLLGVLIAFIAKQPPVLAPGDTFTKVTPGTQPNETVVVHP